MNDAHGEFPASLDRRILAALLEAGSDDSEAFDEELVARFACGWIEHSERDVAITMFARSASARARMREMKALLQLPQPALSEDVALARAVRNATSALTFASLRWKALCKASFAGVEIAKEHRRAFKLACTQVMSEITSAYPRIALTRGISEKSVAISPLGPVVKLSFLKEDDRLIASFLLEEGVQFQSELTLSLSAPGVDSIQLGTAPVIDGKWRLEIADANDVLGNMDLSSAPISLSADAAPPRLLSPLRIVTQENVVVGMARQIEPSVIETGTLRLSIAFPGELRAQWAGHQLSLTIRVAGVRLVIGRWAIDELPPEEIVELRAPLEDAEDGQLELTSILLLELSR